MLKYVLSLLKSDIPEPEEILTLDDAYKLVRDSIQPSNSQIFDKEPNQNAIRQDEESESEIENYTVQTKTGYVTGIINGICKIDNRYIFKDTVENIVIGSKVSFQLVVTCGIHEVVDVNLVEEEHNEWQATEDSTERQKWCVRTIHGQVIGRRGRSLMLDIKPGEIEVDLNTISTDFIPIVGDWVDLEVKCVLDERVVDLTGYILDIIRLYPARTQLKEGKITYWDNIESKGVVNKDIHFSKDALYCGYIPIKGDNVITKSIESDQGSCNWRALEIIPKYLHAQRTSNINQLVTDDDLEESHIGLNISHPSKLVFDKLKDKKSFDLDMINVQNDEMTFIKAEFLTTSRQLRLEKKMGEDVMRKDGEIILKIECTAKCMGETSEAVILHFKSFKIQRWIKIEVKPLSTAFKNGTKFTYINPIYTERSKRDLVKGQGLKQPARFIAKRIPDYTVPQRLLDLISQYQVRNELEALKEKLEVMKPVLVNTLSHVNYEDKFHTLIHLDEIHTMIAMRGYDQNPACFVKCGEFLLLEIPNLAEKRPSIIVGDRVIARNLYKDNSADFEGFIHKIGRQHVFIKFSQSFNAAYDGEDYSIIVIASRTVYRREHHAVSLAVKNLGKDVLFPTKITQKDPQITFIHDSYSDDLSHEENPKRRSIETNKILETIHKFQVANAKTITVPKLEWFNTSLNFYQKEAVRNILTGVCRPLPYIVFGPPGTGKTITLVEAILQVVRMIPHSRLLVSAPSNSAADLLAIRLIDSKVLKPGDLVRLVAHSAVGSIPSKLAPYSATANIERDGTETEQPVATASGLILGLNSSVLGRHKITVCTCSSAGTLYHFGFPKGHFSHIFVDEAGQTSEPTVMIPLAFLDVTSGQVILAGDPMQLGPVVLSQSASQYGLEQSYIERMINRFPYLRDQEGFDKSCGYDPRIITKLLYNYRSLPALLKLPSQLFYNDDLIPTVSVTDSIEAKILARLDEILPTSKVGNTSCMVFHGVVGENYQTEDSPSWFNPHEASQVFYYVNEIYRMGIEPKDIGIITPYKAQTKKLFELFNEGEFMIPKIGTVEDFQGQEYNVILLSTVRSSSKCSEMDISFKLGFVSNPRRLNVSITRAKCLLIIIGNPNLLCADKFWRTVIFYCKENGSYVGCPFNAKK